MMTPRSLLLASAARLREAGVPDPVNDAALLLSSLCRRPPLELRLDQETELDPALTAEYERLLALRLSRIPLQDILKETVFCGLLFRTDSRALIPRPETELLCLWARELIQDPEEKSLLDLCCGTGCIGLTLKHWFPSLSVTLTDASPDALALASENASRLGCRVTLAQGDLFAAVPGRQFDLILSNPPYIPSETCPALQEEVRHEPRMALDGGADGLDFYRRIIPDSLNALKPGGTLLMELGCGEAGAVRNLLEKAGFCRIAVRQDDRRISRMIGAQAPGRRSHG